jgi:hypothetical protein
MGDEIGRQDDGYLYLLDPRCQPVGLGLFGLDS